MRLKYTHLLLVLCLCMCLVSSCDYTLTNNPQPPDFIIAVQDLIDGHVGIGDIVICLEEGGYGGNYDGGVVGDGLSMQTPAGGGVTLRGKGRDKTNIWGGPSPGVYGDFLIKSTGTEVARLENLYVQDLDGDDAGGLPGGMAYIGPLATLELVNVTCRYLRGEDYGGSFAYVEGTLTATGLYVTDVHAAPYGVGAAFACYGPSAVCTVTNSYFGPPNNAHWGQIGASVGATLTVANCIFNSTTAWGGGGAIYANHSGPVTLTDTTVLSSSSNGNGGALWVVSAQSFAATRCVFTGSVASWDAGAVYAKVE